MAGGEPARILAGNSLLFRPNLPPSPPPAAFQSRKPYKIRVRGDFRCANLGGGALGVQPKRGADGFSGPAISASTGRGRLLPRVGAGSSLSGIQPIPMGAINGRAQYAYSRGIRPKAPHPPMLCACPVSSRDGQNEPSPRSAASLDICVIAHPQAQNTRAAQVLIVVAIDVTGTGPSAAGVRGGLERRSRRRRNRRTLRCPSC